MTRNEHSRQALDSWRINLSENWEILFWTQQLDCTEEELRAAIDSAGPIAANVRALLSSRGEPQVQRGAPDASHNS